jgi:hypothetical protein
MYSKAKMNLRNLKGNYSKPENKSITYNRDFEIMPDTLTIVANVGKRGTRNGQHVSVRFRRGRNRCSLSHTCHTPSVVNTVPY